LTLVQDGASLVTGLNISSNTTLKCDNSTTHGFFLKAASNREIVRNVNRSGSTITDHDITIDGGYYNGNKSNQGGVNQADHSPVCGIGMYGIKNLTIKNLTVYNSSAWNIGIGNYQNVTVDTCSLLASTSVSNLNTDGIDLRGPGSAAVLSNLTILAGDDSISLNARDYSSTIVGPYILGGKITNTVIKNITLNIDGGGTQGSWSGIDLISNDTLGVEDVYISNVVGSVQNFVLWLNRDPSDLPAPTTGKFSNIYGTGFNVVQLGTPYGAPVPSGLWVIDGTVNVLQLNNFTVPTQDIKLTASGVATSLVLSGREYGPRSGAITLTIQPIFIAAPGALNKAQKTPLGSGTTIAQAFPFPTFQGTTMVVFVTGFFGSGACTISSIADTIGNSWTLQKTFSDGASGHIVNLYTCVNKSSGSNTVTVTFGQSTAGSTLEIIEYSGSVVDQVTDITQTAASTNILCPSVTTTKTYERILGIGTGPTTGATASGGYTTELSGGGSALGVLVDKNVTAIGAYQPSWTQASAISNIATMSLISQISQNTWIIVGNAGVAGATITYSGQASGTVTADSTGNYVISGLANGAYTITPSKAGQSFSPSNSAQTMASADIAGVTFTSTAIVSGDGSENFNFDFNF